MKFFAWLKHVLTCGDAGVRLDKNTCTYKCKKCGYDLGELK